jgi:hypothetical protein
MTTDEEVYKDIQAGMTKTRAVKLLKQLLYSLVGCFVSIAVLFGIMYMWNAGAASYWTPAFGIVGMFGAAFFAVMNSIMYTNQNNAEMNKGV